LPRPRSRRLNRKHLPSAGGIYTYPAEAIHPALGFLVGWGYALVEALIGPITMILFGYLVGSIAHSEFGWPFTATWVIFMIVASILIVGLNYCGIRVSARVGTILGLFEILVFLALAIWLIAKAGGNNTGSVFTLHFATITGHRGFSGIAAGDFLPLEENRLPTQVGWDIKVDEKRPGSLSYQIIPQVQTQSQQAYATTNPLAPPQQWEFDQVRAQQLQGPAGPALSLMPQRHHRRGQVKVSNQYVVKSSATLVVTCSIINPISIPLAFFEANVMGLLRPQNTYEAYQATNVPTGDPMVPVAPGTRGT